MQKDKSENLFWLNHYKSEFKMTCILLVLIPRKLNNSWMGAELSHLLSLDQMKHKYEKTVKKYAFFVKWQYLCDIVMRAIWKVEGLVIWEWYFKVRLETFIAWERERKREEFLKYVSITMVKKYWRSWWHVYYLWLVLWVIYGTNAK